MSIILVIYYILVKPYESKAVNYLEIFNETFVMVVAYLMLFLTDFTPDLDFQYNVGWLLVALSLGNLLTNMSYMTIISLVALYKTMKATIPHLKAKFKASKCFKWYKSLNSKADRVQAYESPDILPISSSAKTKLKHVNLIN